VRRFQERFERRDAQRKAGKTHPIAHPARIGAGILLILTGLVIGLLPGPGFIPLALGGSFLLASELRSVARFMDWGEARGRAKWRKFRAKRAGRKPKK
jgi:hypothetical protein